MKTPKIDGQRRFSENPAKQAYYARKRAERWRKRYFG